MLYQSGGIGGEIDLAYLTKFYLNLSESMGELLSSTPKKISFIDLTRLVMIYPFKIYVMILLFNRAVLPQETVSTVERVISRYQI